MRLKIRGGKGCGEEIDTRPEKARRMLWEYDLVEDIRRILLLW